MGFVCGCHIKFPLPNMFDFDWKIIGGQDPQIFEASKWCHDWNVTSQVFHSCGTQLWRNPIGHSPIRHHISAHECTWHTTTFMIHDVVIVRTCICIFTILHNTSTFICKNIHDAGMRSMMNQPCIPWLITSARLLGGYFQQCCSTWLSWVEMWQLGHPEPLRIAIHLRKCWDLVNFLVASCQLFGCLVLTPNRWPCVLELPGVTASRGELASEDSILQEIEMSLPQRPRWCTHGGPWFLYQGGWSFVVKDKSLVWVWDGMGSNHPIMGSRSHPNWDGFKLPGARTDPQPFWTCWLLLCFWWRWCSWVFMAEFFRCADVPGRERLGWCLFGEAYATWVYADIRIATVWTVGGSDECWSCWLMTWWWIFVHTYMAVVNDQFLVKLLGMWSTTFFWTVDYISY